MASVDVDDGAPRMLPNPADTPADVQSTNVKKSPNASRYTFAVRGGCRCRQIEALTGTHTLTRPTGIDSEVPQKAPRYSGKNLSGRDPNWAN